jgi:polysaccharide deacetylase 2 family uncharacterized protein YibQ
MAKRKPLRKKRRSKKSRKKVPFRISLIKALTGLSLLALAVAVIGLWVYFRIPSKQTTKPSPPKEKPAFEIYPKEPVPIEKPTTIEPKPLPKKKLPRVVIIIDDLGYDRKIAEKFLELDAPFTFSLLPYSPFQKKIARLAREKGLEIMLHLPMEPIEYPAVKPGPGTLLSAMSPDQLINQLEKDLDTLPSIKGVNNHMGSKLTAESTPMYQVFSILKKRGLFFIDSRTSKNTLCKPSARLFKVPFAQRDVFLDHRQEPDFIRKQIKELINIARRQGEALGIAHPHWTTYRVLKEMLPELEKNVQLVPASKIVRIIG